MQSWSRRQTLKALSLGFGWTAFQGLQKPSAALAGPLPAFQPKAKSVIFLYMSGGVSHVDTFDPKPRLRTEHGKPMPVRIERTQFNNNGSIFGSPFDFKRYGQSGIEVSDLFPHVGKVADELLVIRRMTSKVRLSATPAQALGWFMDWEQKTKIFLAMSFFKADELGHLTVEWGCLDPDFFQPQLKALSSRATILKPPPPI